MAFSPLTSITIHHNHCRPMNIPSLLNLHPDQATELVEAAATELSKLEEEDTDVEEEQQEEEETVDDTNQHRSSLLSAASSSSSSTTQSKQHNTWWSTRFFSFIRRR